MPSGKAFSLTRLVVTTRRCLDDELGPSAYTLHPTYPPLAGSVPSIVVTPECILQSHQNTDKEGLFKSLLDSHSQCPSHYSTLSEDTALCPSISSYLPSPTKPTTRRQHQLCFHSAEGLGMLIFSGAPSPWLTLTQGRKKQSKPLNRIPILLQILHENVSSVHCCKTQHPCTNAATGNS